MVSSESTLGYYSWLLDFLTLTRDPGKGQCLVCSLTGAVTSQRVTEVPKGALSMDGNHAKSVKAKGRLTARRTCRAGTKVGLSDQAVLNGRAAA